MTNKEADKTYKKLSLFEGEPEVGEYFGIITSVSYLFPTYTDWSLYSDHSNRSSYTYTSNLSDYKSQRYILLLKKIDEDIVIEVSTGIPFLLNPAVSTICNDELKELEFFQEKFQKYRKVGLYIDIDDDSRILKVSDEFKLLYFEQMNQDLEDKLKNYVKIAHEKFDDAFNEIINKAYSIASVDNIIYDMEKKCKVKTLTKPNDDQK